MKKIKLVTFLFVSSILISGCVGGNSIIQSITGSSNIPINNSIIIYIHGDGSYLYYDNDGNEILADERILKKAKDVAKYLKDSEVFIFHHKPSTGILFFQFDDEELYYYRNGELILDYEFTYNPEDDDFFQEAKYYNQISSVSRNDSVKKLFLYYGHEIPDNISFGYHSSYPEKEFDISTFSKGIQQFSINKFDAVILSTCKNGTPKVLKELSPLTKCLVASPEDLHLSYMNPEYLKFLNKVNSFKQFVLKFAENSFYELKNSVLTVTTISVYDIDKLFDLTNNFSNLSVNKNDLPGVTVFYNPPKFGKLKNQREHPGINFSK